MVDEFIVNICITYLQKKKAIRIVSAFACRGSRKDNVI